MNERPELNTDLDGKTFQKYYYLKEELVAFCRKNKLPVSGGKVELTNRIACFLDEGRVIKSAAKSRRSAVVGEITEEAVIESGFVCSEKHRAFFKGIIEEKRPARDILPTFLVLMVICKRYI